MVAGGYKRNRFFARIRKWAPGGPDPNQDTNRRVSSPQRLPQTPAGHYIHQFPEMPIATLKIPRRCIAVLTIVQELLDTLDDNRNFCVICRNNFEAGDVLSIFGCCGLFYHLECASKWMNMPPLYGQPTSLPTYATCMPCTARWHRGMLNAYFPPDDLNDPTDLLASGRNVVYVPAGVPPANSSLVDAVTHYGRFGIRVIFGEILGRTPPVRQEELPHLFDTLMERFKDRIYNHRLEDEVVDQIEHHVVDQFADQVMDHLT